MGFDIVMLIMMQYSTISKQKTAKLYTDLLRKLSLKIDIIKTRQISVQLILGQDYFKI